VKAKENRPNRGGSAVDTTLSLVRPLLKAVTPQNDEADEHAVARRINAWLEGGSPPLVRDKPVQLGVNIGARRGDALAGADLPPINWGVRNELELAVLVSGKDFKVEPRLRQFTLTKGTDSKPIHFEVTPLTEGKPILRVSLYLARELDLLEEFEIPIAV